eukprot:1401733-Ditylum_brightwellii.AAC.1
MLQNVDHQYSYSIASSDNSNEDIQPPRNTSNSTSTAHTSVINTDNNFHASSSSTSNQPSSTAIEVPNDINIDRIDKNDEDIDSLETASDLSANREDVTNIEG